MKRLIRCVALLAVLLVPSFALATTTQEILDLVLTSRQKVSAMIGVKNESVQTMLLTEIANLTQDINTKTDAMLADPEIPDETKNKLMEFKMVWDQLVATRDGEMIPAIQAGDSEHAKSIGQEVQNDRFKTIAGLLK